MVYTELSLLLMLIAGILILINVIQTGAFES